MKKFLSTTAFVFAVFVLIFIALAVAFQPTKKFVDRVSSNVSQAIKEPASYAESSSDEVTADNAMALVNNEREMAGLEKLSTNGLLTESACMKLDDMVKYNYWDHVNPDGTDPWHWLLSVGYDYINAGENLAVGFKTSSSMVKGWMDSPGHRENVLFEKFKEQGMCAKFVHFQGRNTWLVVHHFGASVESVDKNNNL